MSTLKQIAKEFWLPFLVAGIWSALNSYYSPQGRNIAVMIGSFSASFFLISWATGQFVRVRRQAKTDKGLAAVEARTVELIDKLDNSADRLISTITGGNSFAHISMSEMGNNLFSPVIIHIGEYPLANVSARICDLQTFAANMAAGNPFASDLNLNVGDVAPGLATMSGINLKAVGPKHDWNVFFSARNGLWTQRIRGRVVNAKWLFAHIVTRETGATSEVLLVEVPDGFPEIGEAEFDNAKRDPAKGV